MKRFEIILCSILITGMAHAQVPVQDRIVGGYVAYYNPSGPLPFAQFHTHLFYSCAVPIMQANGTFDSIQILDQKAVPGDPAYKRMTKVLERKQKNPNLKVMLSFGNSTVNGGFSALVKSEQARQDFASACLQICRRYGFDGIDLDWEFPGMAYSSAYTYDAEKDVDNFSLLMKCLSDTLHPAGKQLTFAGALWDVQISGKTKKYIDIMAIEPYVDFVNLMCYDIMEAPKPHNPLYYSSYPSWSIDGAVRAYKVAGFPMNKIVIGVPFYGRHSYDSSVEDGGELYYKNIEAGLSSGKYIRHWSNAWKVPYITKKGSTTIWASYEDTVSIQVKGQYVIDKGLRGMMYWEVNGDYGSRLQKAIWKVMKPDTITALIFPLAPQNGITKTLQHGEILISTPQGTYDLTGAKH